jgi:hypothetical protein
LAQVTYTKSTVSVPQAVMSEAASRLAAETRRSWLDLFNLMRIFHQGAKTGALKTGLLNRITAPMRPPVFAD